MLEAKFQFAYFCYLEWLYFSCRPCDVFLIRISLIKWKIRKKIKTSTPGNSKFLVLLLGFIHFVGTQNFSKNLFFTPDKDMYVCVSGGKQCKLFEKFCALTSLFHMKITANVTKSSHQDRGPCYLHLQIFFFYIQSSLFRQNKKLLQSLFSLAN